MTTVILLLSAILGLLFPDIISAFSILGGSCATMLVIFFPGNLLITFNFYNFKGFIYVKLSEEKWYHWRKLVLIILTTIFTIMGFAATTLSLLSLMGVMDLD